MVFHLLLNHDDDFHFYSMKCELIMFPYSACEWTDQRQVKRELSFVENIFHVVWVSEKHLKNVDDWSAEFWDSLNGRSSTDHMSN